MDDFHHNYVRSQQLAGVVSTVICRSAKLGLSPQILCRSFALLESILFQCNNCRRLKFVYFLIVCIFWESIWFRCNCQSLKESLFPLFCFSAFLWEGILFQCNNCRRLKFVNFLILCIFIGKYPVLLQFSDCLHFSLESILFQCSS